MHVAEGSGVGVGGGEAEPPGGQALHDDEGGPGRLQVGLPPVQGQELEAGRDRHLLAFTGERTMA